MVQSPPISDSRMQTFQKTLHQRPPLSLAIRQWYLQTDSKHWICQKTKRKRMAEHFGPTSNNRSTTSGGISTCYLAVEQHKEHLTTAGEVTGRNVVKLTSQLKTGSKVRQLTSVMLNNCWKVFLQKKKKKIGKGRRSNHKCQH